MDSTKCKMPYAFVNGLLVIGPFCAVENICVEYHKAYIWFTYNDLVKAFHKIRSQRQIYEKMADSGRQKIIKNHNPCIISEHFFKLFE